MTYLSPDFYAFALASLPYEDQAVSSYSEKMKQFLEESGISTDDIVEMSEGVVVEGDMYVPYSVLQPDAQETNAVDERHFQGAGLGPATPTNAAAISYYIDAGIPQSWKDQIITAMAKWENDAGSDIDFTVETNAGSAKIKFYMDNNPALPSDYQNLSAGTIAMGQFSNNGNIGKWVSLNDAYNGHSSAFKLHVVLHEIGHTLGLGHCEGDYAGDQHIVGTGWGWDGASVMYKVVPPSTTKNIPGQEDFRVASFFYPLAFKLPMYISHQNVGGSYPLKFTIEKPKFSNGAYAQPYYLYVERRSSNGAQIFNSYRSCPDWVISSDLLLGAGFPYINPSISDYNFRVPCPSGTWTFYIRWESFSLGSDAWIWAPSGGAGKRVSHWLIKTITL